MLPSPLRAQAWLATFALIAPALVLGFLFLAASSKQRPSPCDGLCSPSDDVLLFAFPMMFLCIAIWLVAALLIPLLRLEPGLRATHPIVQAVAALIPSVVVAPCALAIAVL